jgi:hypothetical protein
VANGKQAGNTSENSPSKRIRVTYIVPKAVDQNIEAYSQREGMMKNQVVTVALERFLREQSLRPDRTPKISITY